MLNCARGIMMHLWVRRGARSGIVLMALGVTTVVLSVALSTTAYADVTTTGSVLQTASKAIAQQTSAHVVFVAQSGSSSTTEKIVADVGANGGSETLFEGKADLAIRVTPAVAYVRGNSAGLTTLFGLTASQAKRLGTKWESWTPSTKEYSNLKADVTMSSVLSLLPKAKGTKVSTRVTNGTKLNVLKWTTAATKSVPTLSNTLTIVAVGTGLPSEETETAAGGVKIQTQISRWGESITVLAPPVASTIASSKIMG
jgi:hypothetical protein